MTPEQTRKLEEKLRWAYDRNRIFRRFAKNSGDPLFLFCYGYKVALRDIAQAMEIALEPEEEEK